MHAARRPAALLVLVVALAVGACTPGGGAQDTTTTTTATSSSTTAATTTSTAPPETTTPTTEPGPTTTTLPAGTESLPEDIRRQIADLIATTEDLRGLSFTRPPTITVLSDDELEARVRQSFEEDLAEAAVDDALYTLLGLLPGDVDLLELYTDLYGEQVAGFYDGETGEMVVPAGSEAFSPLQQATLVHELTHALTDQNLDVWPRYTAMIDGDRYDEATAFLSVIEGDATLTEVLFIRGLPLAEQQDLLTESFAVDSAVFDAAPLFVRESLVFPYESGLAFVQRLYDLGGFEGVADAYGVPPSSTEQIITPRDYRRDEPIAVDVTPIELPGYTLEYDTTWGELGFVLMFEQVLGGRSDASDGWGGDRFLAWHDGSDIAFALEYRGDTDRDAQELYDALADYVPAAMAVGEDPQRSDGAIRYVGDDYAGVFLDGDTVVFLGASDPSVAPELETAYAP